MTGPGELEAPSGPPGFSDADGPDAGIVTVKGPGEPVQVVESDPEPSEGPDEADGSEDPEEPEGETVIVIGAGEPPAPDGDELVKDLRESMHVVDSVPGPAEGPDELEEPERPEGLDEPEGPDGEKVMVRGTGDPSAPVEDRPVGEPRESVHVVDSDPEPEPPSPLVSVLGATVETMVATTVPWMVDVPSVSDCGAVWEIPEGTSPVQVELAAVVSLEKEESVCRRRNIRRIKLTIWAVRLPMSDRQIPSRHQDTLDTAS